MPRWREIDFAARGRFRARTRFRGHILPKTPHGVRSAFAAAAGVRAEGVARAKDAAYRVASVAFARGAAFRGRFRGRSERGGEGAEEGWRKRVEERRGGGRSRVVLGARGGGVLGRGGQRLGGTRARNRWREGREGRGPGSATGAGPEAKEARPRRRESADPETRGAKTRIREGRGSGAPAREGRASGPFCAAALDRAIGRLLYWGAAFVARVLRARRHAR